MSSPRNRPKHWRRKKKTSIRERRPRTTSTITNLYPPTADRCCPDNGRKVRNGAASQAPQAERRRVGRRRRRPAAAEEQCEGLLLLVARPQDADHRDEPRRLAEPLAEGDALWNHRCSLIERRGQSEQGTTALQVGDHARRHAREEGQGPEEDQGGGEREDGRPTRALLQAVPEGAECRERQRAAATAVGPAGSGGHRQRSHLGGRRGDRIQGGRLQLRGQDGAEASKGLIAAVVVVKFHGHQPA